MKTKELPASVGAKLLDINRTSIYYKGTPISDEELACKEIIDHLHTDHPAWGARQMSAQLKIRGYQVGLRTDIKKLKIIVSRPWKFSIEIVKDKPEDG